MFLGGHEGDVYKGFVSDRPNVGKHVAFRVTDVRRPGGQIVFAESVERPVGASGATGEDRGLHFVSAPRSNGPRWTVAPSGAFALASGAITGLPQGRFGKAAVVGFLDGHVEARTPRELNDMRLWAPKATSETWDFVP